MVLKELGFSNCVLHSMTRQQLRLEAMALFKSHKVKILVATDLASRLATSTLSAMNSMQYSIHKSICSGLFCSISAQPNLYPHYQSSS